MKPSLSKSTRSDQALPTQTLIRLRQQLQDSNLRISDLRERLLSSNLRVNDLRERLQGSRDDLNRLKEERLARANRERQNGHSLNERSFLSWLRIGILLIGLGLAVSRLNLFLQQVQQAPIQASLQTVKQFYLLGAGLIGSGVLILALAIWSFNRTFHQIESETYQPTRIVVWIATAVLIGLGMLGLLFISFPLVVGTL